MRFREQRKVAYCTKRIETNPKDAAAYHQRARAWIKLQEYKQAIADCNKVIGLRKENAKLYYHRGLAYIGLKEYEEAIENWTKALELNSKYSEAYNNRGQAYAILQRYDRAIADFSRAIGINPKYALAYRNRASVYHVKGKYESALADYEKTLSLDPNDKLAYYNRSTIIRILEKQGRKRTSLAQASTLLERDERVNRRDGISLNNIGIVLGSLIFGFFFIKLVTDSTSSFNTASSQAVRQERTENTPNEEVRTEQAIKLDQPIPIDFNDLDLEVPQGVFNYGGSTVFAPIRAEVDSKIQEDLPDFRLRHTRHAFWNSSSSIGIRMLIENQLSLAQSSRPLTGLEKKAAKENGFDLRQIAVAIDGVAIAVHPDLDIPGLTIAQLRDIYLGKITNWQEVGGPDLSITAISKSPHASGTADYFVNNILAQKHLTGNVQLTTSTTEGLRRVNSNPGAIFYESAAELVPQCSVRSLPIAYNSSSEFVSPYQQPSLDRGECNAENRNKIARQAFQDASYPMTRKLYVIVKKNGDIDEEAGLAYARLLLSEPGQKALQKAGFVAVR